MGFHRSRDRLGGRTFAPFAPGTGSLVGVIFAAAGKWTVGPHFVWLALSIILLSVPSAEPWVDFGTAKTLSESLLDEIAALFLIQIFFPLSLPGLVAQFLWFRLFDILKPPPCRQGRLPGRDRGEHDCLLVSVAASWPSGSRTGSTHFGRDRFPWFLAPEDGVVSCAPLRSITQKSSVFHRQNY